MSEPFIGQIAIFSFGFPPKGWALANGQLLPIRQNTALFALLGTFYGGDGVTTFKLPDLRGRVPMYVGNGHVQGESDGLEAVTLTTPELPAHSHAVSCNKNAGTQASPSGTVWAADGAGNFPYSNGEASAMAAGTVGPSPAAGGQPHENRAPFAVVNFCIALSGIFPSRN
jgi:microcystin-dependent protein